MRTEYHLLVIYVGSTGQPAMTALTFSNRSLAEEAYAELEPKHDRLEVYRLYKEGNLK